jgi:CDP-4-dehydro-6-deoxyglucose reductase, E3
MGERLPVSRAAHLAGVSRQELQRLILQGELHTFEGRLDLDELKGCFPQLAMDDSSEFQRVALIKQSAFGRRVQATVAPDLDDLERRLHKRETDLAIARARLERYRGVVEGLCRHLTSLQAEATTEQREILGKINNWLVEKIESQF